MKRAFLFGFAVQSILVGVIFLVLDDQMLPMTRSPFLGVLALCLGVASAFFAWRAPPHPSWAATIGLGIAGFLALFALIPIIEIVVVLMIAAMPG